MLWGVAQEHLARTLFPLGGLEKSEIRRLAAEMGMAHVAGKKDSYEICFVPDDDYRGFLSRRHDLAGLAGGRFVHSETGEDLGTHEGYPFYTVGQRRGLGIALGEPAYVVRIEPETNTVVVGPRAALAERALRASGVVWSGAAGLDGEAALHGAIRHHDPGVPALVRQTGPDALEAVFSEPRTAIAPGQAAVFYDGDDVVAGGWIDRADARRQPEDAPGVRRAPDPAGGAVTEPGPGQRECPSCAMAVPADAEACPVCGYEFPVARPGVRPMAWVFVALMVVFALPVLAWLAGWFG